MHHILSVMLSKKIQFVKKKNNCMPKIEDCAFKKEHPIVFYWILKMWEADFDSGILIKLVVFLIKQNSKFLQLLFYEYCTQCYFRPVLFLLRVIFAPCYFPPSSLANGLTPSWIRPDEVLFKEKYYKTLKFAHSESRPLTTRAKGAKIKRERIFPCIYTFSIFFTLPKHTNLFSFLKNWRKKKQFYKIIYICTVFQ